MLSLKETIQFLPKKTLLPLSGFPLLVAHRGMVAEQQADSSLSDSFNRVLPESEMRDSAPGYFLQDSLLVRKWARHSDTFMGDPVFQVVLPVSYHQSVLKVAHDESGHSGVRTTGC